MGLEFDIQLERREFKLDLSAEFHNKTYGIYGHSGAGKTSLFSLLNGLLRPSTGFIKLDGETLVNVKQKIFIPPNKRRIGVVFQEKLLFPHLNVRENLEFGCRYIKDRSISLSEVTELLGLNNLLDVMPNRISGGEQQRVAIGRAILTSPKLLLLDEPFNAVDNNLRESILPYIKRVGDSLNIPMLIISHDLPDIQRITDDIYVIEKGKKVGFGSIFDIIKSNPIKKYDLYRR
ncbi:ATP-binding cassette domain-containing protein [Thiospirochaeta perfilievii]|uniref:ATP-binding cassette domain-containing protein n=1 Tax=Thiospirochaeta perfilievii TaxID=252967 RepID=A0A5C1QEZ7_9SPIO|nr:ATP-binding cassette domain-containing protein [Thiospirochaeta perfilievii]QEN05958.1 ATP-binding cassette domain-containing protein [Thiospirochaeta perfilievii]